MNQELIEDLDNLKVARSSALDVENCESAIKTLQNPFCMLSQNIRSINCNYTNFLTLLERSRVNWDVIVLTECWLTESTIIPYLDGYKSTATTSHINKNDGIVVYYKEALQLSILEPVFQTASCKLLKINDNIAIICLYRSPSNNNIDNFITSLNECLLSLSSIKKYFCNRRYQY